MNETRALSRQNAESHDSKPAETQKQQLQKQQLWQEDVQTFSPEALEIS